jgi:hypothetical protein
MSLADAHSFTITFGAQEQGKDDFDRAHAPEIDPITALVYRDAEPLFLVRAFPSIAQLKDDLGSIAVNVSNTEGDLRTVRRDVPRLVEGVESNGAVYSAVLERLSHSAIDPVAKMSFAQAHRSLGRFLNASSQDFLSRETIRECRIAADFMAVALAAWQER